MGYRSNVCIRTTPRGLDMIRDAWDSAGGVPLCESASEERVSGDVATVVFEDIKWDGGYAEVASIYKLLDADMDGEPWCFARVGESGDYEELQCGAIVRGEGQLERYYLFTDQFIEGEDMLPIIPSFNLREFSNLVMTMFARLEGVDPSFAASLVSQSRLLGEMVSERDRQFQEMSKGEQDGRD